MVAEAVAAAVAAAAVAPEVVADAAGAVITVDNDINRTFPGTAKRWSLSIKIVTRIATAVPVSLLGWTVAYHESLSPRCRSLCSDGL